MKVFDISITKLCNNGCPYCSQRLGYTKNNNGKHEFMPIEIFQLFLYNEQPDILLISGGEPSLHPDYEDFLQIGGSLSMHSFVQTFQDNKHKIIDLRDSRNEWEVVVVDKGLFRYDEANRTFYIQMKKEGMQDYVQETKKLYLDTPLEYKCICAPFTIKSSWYESMQMRKYQRIITEEYTSNMDLFVVNELYGRHYKDNIFR